ncbi:MAG: TPM domain-containing protein [Candidatus Binatia bacterium]
MIGALATIIISIFLNANAFALQLPPLNAAVNDLAGMFPPASAEDLQQRLHRFNTETALTVVVLTVKSLNGEIIDSVGRNAFQSLPLSESNLQTTVLLVVARKEREVDFQAGTSLQKLLPKPATTEKLRSQIVLYFDGLRPDLGIQAAVHYLFRVLKGDVRVGSQTAEEKLEETSLSGGEAGAIFALCLGPFLAFFIGGLWGIYATDYGMQRIPRLLMGAIFGGGTAKIVAMLTSLLGAYSDNLWYFIMGLAIPLGALGSLTEFWMSGDWRGIPRVKGPKRKPEDNMGI